MRGAAAALVVLSLAAGEAVSVSAQQPDFPAPEQALVELSLNRAAARTVQAYRSGSDVLLPVGQFFDLAEIAYESTPTGGVEAVIQPGNQRVVIEPGRDTITADRRPTVVRPDQHFAEDGELYLSAQILGSLLGIQFRVDWTDLSVVVADPSTLPIGRRLAREAAWAARLAGSQGASPDLTLGLERHRWNGVALDYSVLTPSQDILGGGSYSTALGADAFGGSLELGVATVGPSRDGKTRTDASWTGVWRDSRWITQLRLGDGYSTGPSPRTVRGFSLSNAPYLRPSILGSASYTGRLGPGWQVEAYRGGRLIAIDSVNALGQYAIDAPIQYGENPIDFVAYGPFGEVREFSRTYRVINDVLAWRHFEYGASFGACRVGECRTSANVDLRYGLTQRWTVQGGMDQFARDTLPNLFHPYLGLTGSLGNDWGVQLQGVSGAVLRSAVRYEPSTSLQLSAEYNAFASRTVAPILTPAGRQGQLTLQGFLQPIARIPSLYLDGSFDRAESVTGVSTSGRLGAAFQVHEIRLLPAVRVQSDAPPSGPAITRTYLGLNSIMLPQPALGSFFGEFSARASFEIDGSLQTSSFSAYLSRNVTRGLRLESGVAWNRSGLGNTVYTFTLATELPTVRAYSTVTAPGSGPAFATQFVQGSVLYDPSTSRASLVAGPAMQRAGVSGRVFLDQNGNGVYDEGEELIPGVRVRVGMNNALSDSGGVYRVWDVSPYDPVMVSVDSLTLPSPLWTPTLANVSVEPGPNSYRRLDLAIAPGGTLDGRLLRGMGVGQGLAGIPILLTELRSHTFRTIVTFSDGEFYAMGLKPGEYELTVDPRALARLHVAPVAVRFSMAASEDGASVSGLEVHLSSDRPR